jgi:cytochrome c2
VNLGGGERNEFTPQLASMGKQLYEVKYQCQSCHTIGSAGGYVGPNLSNAGNWLTPGWIDAWLKNPQSLVPGTIEPRRAFTEDEVKALTAYLLTLRPTLTFRMPQFNMTDQEASIVADYLGMVFQSPLATPAAVDRNEFTPQSASRGKQLYEVKYQCQSCHTIGSAGGYVGPNLSNAGNWLTPAWIEAWLENQQSLVPGTIEPRRAFTEDEVKALTAYLSTLRQAGPARAGAAQGGGR